jgi:hypothetical protein
LESRRNQLTAKGLNEIAKNCQNLTGLYLRHNEKLSGKIENLTLLTNLVDLNLYDVPQISTETIESLFILTNLETLELVSHVSLMNDNLKNITSLTNLKSLDISFCKKLDDKLVKKTLIGLPNLEKLIMLMCPNITMTCCQKYLKFTTCNFEISKNKK